MARLTCPNCGQEYESMRCPNCGRSRAGSNRAAAIVLLMLLALPSAAMGACCVAGGLDAARQKDNGSAVGQMVLFGLFAAGAFVTSVYAAVKLWRS